MYKQEDFTMGFMVGVSICTLIFLLMLDLLDARPIDVYTQAYKDYKAGKIESVMRERCPANWVKLNPPEKVKEVKQEKTE